MKLNLILGWASLLLVSQTVLAEPPSDEQRVEKRVVELIELSRETTSWTQDTTNRVLEDLAANDGRLRWAAGWALGNRPPCVIPRLDEIARDGSPQQRRAAAMALSRLVERDSSALLPLLRMRKSRDAIEEYYVAQGIARVSLEQTGVRRTLVLLPEAMGIRPSDGLLPHGLTRTNGTPWLHNTDWLELTLFKLGPPSVTDAQMLKELLNHSHPVTRRMAQEQIAMLGERAADFTDPLAVEVESAGSTRDVRRIRIKELLAQATDKSSLAKETRSEAMRILSLRRRAYDSICDDAASVVRDFIRDMRGAAPSRKVAVERLKSSFNDMEEANAVLILLHNDYGYRGVYRPYVGVARRALGLDKQPSQVAQDETAFTDAVLAVLNDPPGRSAWRKLVNSGPAGVPFLASFVGHPEKRIHVPLCYKLRSMGPLAAEATPALRKAVDGEHSEYTLMALERVDPSAYHEVVNRCLSPAGAGR